MNPTHIDSPPSLEGRDGRRAPLGARQGHEHGNHGGRGAGHGKHAGHHVEMFRRRFWWSLLLTVPVVLTSHMVMDWFGYDLDFYGIELVGPVLGSVIFWGGWPFLEGAWREIQAGATPRTASTPGLAGEP